jgi:hypothetical protein
MMGAKRKQVASRRSTVLVLDVGAQAEALTGEVCPATLMIKATMDPTSYQTPFVTATLKAAEQDAQRRSALVMVRSTWKLRCG